MKEYKCMDCLTSFEAEYKEDCPSCGEDGAVIEVSAHTDKLSVEKLQEHLLPYKKETVQKIIDEKMQLVTADEFLKLHKESLTAIRENDKLQEELESCIQTLIEASAAATITQDIVVGNLVDRKLADLAKTYKLAVDYIEKVTGKNIDVVLAENAALEAEEEE